MPIKLVINGYFRSGTSIIWQALKEANPSLDIFYEPCHGSLLKYLDEANHNRKLDELHGMFLWDEYINNKSLYEKIKLYHPNPGRTFPNSMTDFEKYINIFHSEERSVALQSNRWHFFLESIVKQTECQVVHIIRNPFHVLHSTRLKYLNETKYWHMRILKKLLWPMINGKAFELDELYEYLYWRYSRKIAPESNLIWFQKKKWSMLEKFVFVWTMSNYEAIKQTLNVGGSILVYEKMQSEPAYATKVFKNHGISFSEQLIKTQKNSIFMKSSEINSFFKIASYLGIRNEFQFILNHAMK